MSVKFTLLYSRTLKPHIRMTGGINNVLTAAVDEQNTIKRTPSQTGFSLGLGAVGDSFDSVKSKLGELFTTPNLAGVLSSGEKNIPEVSRGADTEFYTPFNVSLGAEFEEVYSFHCEKPAQIKELYSALFDKARDLPDFKGLFGVSMIFRIHEFYGSLVRTSPLKGSLPHRAKLTDPENFEKWFIIDRQPVYADHLAVSAGVGLMPDKHRFEQDALDRIFYVHPGNVPGGGLTLHNHCLILPPGDLPDFKNEYTAMVNNTLKDNQVLDVKHILDNTTLTKGFAAVNYIVEIGNL
ncbi:hypothetical protein ISS30_05795 [bacterium]|nr:hypothetical protein [bacterium]